MCPRIKAVLPIMVRNCFPASPKNSVPRKETTTNWLKPASPRISASPSLQWRQPMNKANKLVGKINSNRSQCSPSPMPEVAISIGKKTTARGVSRQWITQSPESAIANRSNSFCTSSCCQGFLNFITTLPDSDIFPCQDHSTNLGVCPCARQPYQPSRQPAQKGLQQEPNIQADNNQSNYPALGAYCSKSGLSLTYQRFRVRFRVRRISEECANVQEEEHSESYGNLDSLLNRLALAKFSRLGRTCR